MKIGTNTNITQHNYTVKKEKSQEPSDTVILGSNHQDNELIMGKALKNQKAFLGDVFVLGSMVADDLKKGYASDAAEIELEKTVLIGGVLAAGFGVIGYGIYQAGGWPAILATAVVGGLPASLLALNEKYNWFH